jgi:hypothetical protein
VLAHLSAKALAVQNNALDQALAPQVRRDEIEAGAMVARNVLNRHLGRSVEKVAVASRVHVVFEGLRPDMFPTEPREKTVEIVETLSFGKQHQGAPSTISRQFDGGSQGSAFTLCAAFPPVCRVSAGSGRSRTLRARIRSCALIEVACRYREARSDELFWNCGASERDCTSNTQEGSYLRDAIRLGAAVGRDLLAISRQGVLHKHGTDRAFSFGLAPALRA